MQVAGGALPVSLSDAVRALRARRLLAFTVAAAPCVDADVQAVNVYSALAYAARRRRRRDRLRDRAGHRRHRDRARPRRPRGGRRPSTRPPRSAAGRCSRRACRGADARPRHRGLSHHTQAVLRVCLATPLVPDELEPERWREECAGLPLSHMGRGPDEDPEFFAAAFAAGRLARSLSDVMEERRLGPVIGLGTWRTFGGDASLARDVVGGGARERRAADRLVADVRRCRALARRRARRASCRCHRRDEDLGELGRRRPRAVRGAARLVRRSDRDRAGAQPRRVARASGVARGGARRRAGSAGSA